ncbi:hypothetical protein L5B97_01160 [Avibacterium sp. 20-15]|uniref:hypothetical protein n=1 Tax=unclassified Avibacterium TaxID=2685287 RepID=UPI002025B8B2|nr:MULTISPECIES: hypothetical protein [unclassified Avibacterium]MCW9732102.1 hypothetical protein [Avibacterium sp. 20-15]URL02779.1 hypothetical protein L4F91_04050 [Avibacterium sp. 20-126]URL04280.1 hypothetical protein L4F93_12240 [Avibacterium sp. 20-132]
MKLKSKLMLGAIAALLSSQVIASAGQPVPVDPSEYNGVGCTKEYDPTPYKKKDGTIVTAPNRCVAAKWASEGL